MHCQALSQDFPNWYIMAYNKDNGNGAEGQIGIGGKREKGEKSRGSWIHTQVKLRADRYLI